MNESIAFACGVLFGIMLVVVGIIGMPILIFAMDHIHPNDPHCMGWGTTGGNEFSPPSTEWYTENCHNLTFPITTDRQGHITESCACYESKHGLPIQLDSPMVGFTP